MRADLFHDHLWGKPQRKGHLLGTGRKKWFGDQMALQLIANQVIKIFRLSVIFLFIPPQLLALTWLASYETAFLCKHIFCHFFFCFNHICVLSCISGSDSGFDCEYRCWSRFTIEDGAFTVIPNLSASL